MIIFSFTCGFSLLKLSRFFSQYVLSFSLASFFFLFKLRTCTFLLRPWKLLGVYIILGFISISIFTLHLNATIFFHFYFLKEKSVFSFSRFSEISLTHAPSSLVRKYSRIFLILILLSVSVLSLVLNFFTVQVLFLVLHTLINGFFLFVFFLHSHTFLSYQDLLGDFHDPFLPPPPWKSLLLSYSFSHGNHEQSRQSTLLDALQLLAFCHPFSLANSFRSSSGDLFRSWVNCSFSLCPSLSHHAFVLYHEHSVLVHVCVDKIPDKPPNLFAGNCPQILARK